jgi:hypothetical protein
MLTEQIVAVLIAERDKLSRAIEALQGPAKRRGRPPKNPLASTFTLAAAPATVAAKPKKRARTFNAAQREAAAERMRQRWAEKKKAEGKAKKAGKAD